MKEILQNNGWNKSGGCSKCGIQNWVSPKHPEYVVKTKLSSNVFKISKGKDDIFGYTPQHELSQKLSEL